MMKSKSSTLIQTPLVLGNGIKLHVQPQNLLLAANLANLSQSSATSATSLYQNGVSSI